MMQTDMADYQAEQEEVEQIEETQKNEEPNQKEMTPHQPEQKTLTTSTTGVEYLASKSIEEKFRWASAYLKGGMVPASYKNPTQVMVGLEYARELEVPPLVGIRNIAVIKGTPSIWGELPLALVKRSGKLESKSEFCFDKDLKKICWENGNITAEVYGAYCRTMRVGDEDELETWFTLDDAKRAGLLGRDNVWKTYPRRMLQMRARSQNLKDNFPDVLLGLSIAEYDWNVIPSRDASEINVGRNGVEKRDIASELNDDCGVHGQNC